MNPLAPRARLLYLGLGFTIYVLAGPGILLPEGSPLGALGLIPWALSASRPGPWKKRIEWIAGACALTAQVTWMGIVFWFAILWLFIGYGCWSVWGGWVMKRLSARLPLALSTPLAWIGCESLLAWTPPPIGLSWLRLGHYWNDWPGLAGSGRVWGVVGLGFVLAALAGLIADFLAGTRWRGSRASWLSGLIPAALAVVLALVVRPPETELGPRLMLVQPAFEQARKQGGGRPEELFLESAMLTKEGLDGLRAKGERAPDLVCWGETMFPFPGAVPGLMDRIGEMNIDPWFPFATADARQRRAFLERLERDQADAMMYLFGGEYAPGRFAPALLDPETHFLSGVEVLIEREGRLRRTNSVMLWGSGGVRLGRAEKRHLAPGGETMVGLEKLQWVRDIIYEVAGYVPDLAAAEELSVLELPGASGRTWRLGATACFDNAFTDVYAEPLRNGPLDFHLVVSNEAWYEDAQELDQMVAFSRMHALCTARSFVRCANSGVSAAFDPRGEELARLVIDGRDREVRGTLMVDVPVPVAGDAATRTPFVWLEPWLKPLAALLPLVLIALQSRRRRLHETEA